MSEVQLKNLSKAFGDVVAVDEVDITASHGEFLVLLGPSGCGKSTLLRMIAGLTPPTSGELLIGGVDMKNVDVRRRDIAFVFQSYALYPHMTVRRNIAFPLLMREAKWWHHIPIVGSLVRRKLMRRQDIVSAVEEAADMLGLSELLDRRPVTLSGGQRQRVAVGRAIVRRPQVFLMDEPLSNLDANLRVHMRAEISRLHRDLDATFIYVTHDQTEALSLGTLVAVMDLGRVQQVGPPQQVFQRPANTFVARFIGNPPMNLIPVIQEADGTVTVGGASFTLSRVRANALTEAAKDPQQLLLGLRPTQLSIALEGVTNEPTVKAVVTGVENTGDEALIGLRLEATAGFTVGEDANGSTSNVFMKHPDYLSVRPDQVLNISIDLDGCCFFDQSTGELIEIDEGGDMSVAPERAADNGAT